jgi:hypothetical protein
MNVVDLRNKFIAVRKQEPLDDFELLHFARICYVRGDLTIIEYRDIVKVLEKENSYNPEGLERFV